MSRKIHAHGLVENGELRLLHRKAFMEGVSQFSGDVLLTVEKATRTNKQNAYYHVCCEHVATQLEGWTHEDVHEYNKILYNAQIKLLPDPETGELLEIKVPGSTAVLPKDAFAELLEKCNIGWGERGIQFFPPNIEREM
jgi:hypothetical protein